MLRILLLLAAVSSLAAPCKDREIRGTKNKTNLNIQVLGSAAKFKIFPSGSNNAERKFIMFEFDDVKESDGSHAIKSFSKYCLNWELNYEIIDGVNTTHVLMSASDVDVGKGGRLTFIGFDVWFVEEETEFTNGNETVTAPAVSMKFSINVTGWPFKSAQNGLRINLNVKSAKNGSLFKLPNSTYLIDDGSSGGSIQFAETVLIDGTAEFANVTIARNDKIKKEIYIDFPNFQNSATYDPVVTLRPATTSGFPGYGIALIVLALLFVGLGLCCYCKKLKAAELDA
jgi:hypothetical protein